MAKNVVRGLLSFEKNQNQSKWQMSVYDEKEQVCKPLDIGKKLCTSKGEGYIEKSYERSKIEGAVHLTNGENKLVLPMCIADKEETTFFIGSPGKTSSRRSESFQEEKRNQIPRTQPAPRGGIKACVDYEILAIEVTNKGRTFHDGRSIDLNKDDLEGFIIKQRTNWPGAIMDLKSLWDSLKEFGTGQAYTKIYRGRKYIIFKGLPGRKGMIFHQREIFAGTRYLLENTKVVQFGFGMKSALRSGAKGTVISFFIVGAIDVYEELLQDKPSLLRLGITLSSDTVKLGLSAFAAALAASGVFVLGAPVWAIAGTSLLVGIGVGLLLDFVDERLGITEWLQEKAREVKDKIDYSISNLLYQLEWCAMHPYQCFGRGGGRRRYDY